MYWKYLFVKNIIKIPTNLFSGKAWRFELKTITVATKALMVEFVSVQFGPDCILTHTKLVNASKNSLGNILQLFYLAHTMNMNGHHIKK